MALITCPECSNKISDKAAICPNCGYKLKNKYTYKTIIIMVSVAILIAATAYVYKSIKLSSPKDDRKLSVTTDLNTGNKSNPVKIKISYSHDQWTILKRDDAIAIISVSDTSPIVWSTEADKVINIPNKSINLMLKKDKTLWTKGLIYQDNYISSLLIDSSGEVGRRLITNKTDIKDYTKILDNVSDVGVLGNLAAVQKDDYLYLSSNSGNIPFNRIYTGPIKINMSGDFVGMSNKLYKVGGFSTGEPKLYDTSLLEPNETWDGKEDYNLQFLKADGTVWSYDYKNNQKKQVLGVDNVIAISVGAETNQYSKKSYGHVLALRKDGTVWAWGNNEYGQLGNRSTNDAKVPVQVIDLSNIVDISAGSYHSVAVDKNGKTWIWGRGYPNDFRQQRTAQHYLMPVERILQ